MQLLGWEVDVINTVQFSNHTGFGRWGGTRFDAAHLDDLFSGLDKNGLLRYARVLTGAYRRNEVHRVKLLMKLN